MYAFAVEKTSALFDDAELTEEELAQALRIRTLLMARLPGAFRGYVRRLAIQFTVDHKGQATVCVRMEMVLQDPGAIVEVANSVVVVPTSVYNQMVANTTISLIADVLAVGVREGGEYAPQYRDAARLLSR